MNKKTLIITIEISARELLSKCLLALEAASRGYRVYLCSFQSVRYLENDISSSIFFHKSTYESKVLHYKKSLGATFVILDEESGFAIPRSTREEFIKHRFRPYAVSSDKYSHIFTIGDTYRESMNSMANMKGIGVHATGWPRIDLWRDEYKYLHLEEARKIIEEHGDFFLLISSFGITSKKTYLERKEFNAKRFPYGNKTIDYRYGSLVKYIKHVKELSSLLGKNEKIIIRPHTSESPKDWENHFSDFSNVEVVHEGDVTPWILAAKALIQHGSTVGVQAALSGIPSIQLGVEKKDGITDTIIYEVSDNAIDSVEAYSKMREMCRLPASVITERAIHLVGNEVSSLKGDMAVTKIVDVLDTISVFEQEKVSFSCIEMLIHKLRKRASGIKEKTYQKLPWRKSSFDRTSQEKIPGGLKADDIESIVDSLNVYGELSFKVSQVTVDLISIESEAP